MQFKFIYFDVGGVVIKDFSKTQKWQDLQESLGIPPELSHDFDEIWSQYERGVCIGRDVEELLPIIEKQLGIQIPLDTVLLDEFVNRFEENSLILPLLKKAESLSSGVGLLTNMYPNMLSKIRQAHLLPDFEFTVVVDSSIEKTLKPENKIFEIAQQKAGYSPSEMLFIDNSQMHLDAAEKLGWNVYFYDSADYEKSSADLMEFLDRNLLSS